MVKRRFPDDGDAVRRQVQRARGVGGQDLGALGAEPFGPHLPSPHRPGQPLMPFGLEQTGGPNEPWSFGPEACEHITAALFLRDGAHLPITG